MYDHARTVSGVAKNLPAYSLAFLRYAQPSIFVNKLGRTCLYDVVLYHARAT